jgi:hypothetical protein
MKNISPTEINFFEEFFEEKVPYSDQNSCSNLRLELAYD